MALEASEGVSVTRSTARQKLSKLNNLQFHELATDVYDELMRRTAEGHSMKRDMFVRILRCL